MEGEEVWLRDEHHAWVRAEILKKQEKDSSAIFTVKTLHDGNEREITAYLESEDGNSSQRNNLQEYNDIKPCNHDFPVSTSRKLPTNANPAAGVEDLISLPHLHEPAILHVLCSRYAIDQIYTYTGPILLAVNPFQRIPGLYSPDLLSDYYSAGLLVSQGLGDDSQKLPPHVYARADAAYRCMKDYLDSSTFVKDSTADTSKSLPNQSLLVSGESGAGKTETTKIIMQYLATVGRDGGPTGAAVGYDPGTGVASTAPGSPSKHPKEVSTTERVLSSNPILEAFGNAKTSRNENSSRFGKFIELQFSQRGHLVGARIHTYLLEKVRLVGQSKGERGYHAFYQLLMGSPEEWRNKWCLNASSDAHPGTEFRLLNQSDCYTLRDAEDANLFQSTANALSIMKISPDDSEALWKSLAGLLWLGNVNFEDGTDDQAKVKDADPSEKRPKFDGNDISAFSFASKLLGIEEDQLLESVTTKRIEVRGEVTYIQYSAAQASDIRDAIIKYIYGKLFDWLVKNINEQIRMDDITQNFIGVLDIFGFEQFEHNSFEQLCINYTNEALQQHFNSFVFKIEQAEYAHEGIEWSHISFPDNQDCLDMIEARRPPGLLSLLDETCLMPKGSDEAFARKCYEHLKDHTRFSVSNKQRVRSQFVVSHYAGDVIYSSEGFCEKNKDTISDDAIEVIAASSSPVIAKATKDSASVSGNQALPAYAARAIVDAERRGALKAGTAESLGAVANSESNTASSSTKPKRKGKMMAATLGTQFRQQLKFLMTIIRATSPHYVRCLKPNNECAPKKIDRIPLVSQLRCGGVLEAVRVSRSGYPVRLSHDAFFTKYRSFIPVVSRLIQTRAIEDSEYEDSTTYSVTNAIRNTLNSDQQVQKALSTLVSTKTSVSSSAAESLLEIVYALRLSVAQEAFRCILAMENDQETISLSPHELHTIGFSSVASNCLQVLWKQTVRRAIRFKREFTEDLVPKDAANTLVDAKDVQVGKTKVFFRQTSYEFFESLRSSISSTAAQDIQRIMRGCLARRLLIRAKVAIICIQCAVRRTLAQKQLHMLRQHYASIKIQRIIRGFLEFVRYQRKRYAAIYIQSVVRGITARQYANQLRRTFNATLIAAWYRSTIVRRHFMLQKRSIIRIQTMVRARLARSYARRLREEARNVSNLQQKNIELMEANQSLQAQIKQLQDSSSNTNTSNSTNKGHELEVSDYGKTWLRFHFQQLTEFLQHIQSGLKSDLSFSLYPLDDTLIPNVGSDLYAAFNKSIQSLTKDTKTVEKIPTNDSDTLNLSDGITCNMNVETVVYKPQSFKTEPETITQRSTEMDTTAEQNHTTKDDSEGQTSAMLQPNQDSNVPKDSSLKNDLVSPTSFKTEQSSVELKSPTSPDVPLERKYNAVKEQLKAVQSTSNSRIKKLETKVAQLIMENQRLNEHNQSLRMHHMQPGSDNADLDDAHQTLLHVRRSRKGTKSADLTQLVSRPELSRKSKHTQRDTESSPLANGDDETDRMVFVPEVVRRRNSTTQGKSYSVRHNPSKSNQTQQQSPNSDLSNSPGRGPSIAKQDITSINADLSNSTDHSANVSKSQTPLGTKDTYTELPIDAGFSDDDSETEQRMQNVNARGKQQVQHPYHPNRIPNSNPNVQSNTSVHNSSTQPTGNEPKSKISKFFNAAFNRVRAKSSTDPNENDTTRQSDTNYSASLDSYKNTAAIPRSRGHRTASMERAEHAARTAAVVAGKSHRMNHEAYIDPHKIPANVTPAQRKYLAHQARVSTDGSPMTVFQNPDTRIQLNAEMVELKRNNETLQQEKNSLIKRFVEAQEMLTKLDIKDKESRKLIESLEDKNASMSEILNDLSLAKKRESMQRMQLAQQIDDLRSDKRELANSMNDMELQMKTMVHTQKQLQELIQKCTCNHT